MPVYLDRAHMSPVKTIVACFTAWKTLTLWLAVSSPGIGYDTSANLLYSSPRRQDASLLPMVQRLISRLTRWDALYFVSISNRYYLYEQDWAFGWGWTRAISFLTACLRACNFQGGIEMDGLVAIVLANMSHLLSVLVLYSLSKSLFPKSRGIGLVTALLHIISPAGIFLSAPYAESSCAFLTFLGHRLFIESLALQESLSTSTSYGDLLILCSGVMYGFATTLRSNAILSGTLFLEEAFRACYQLGYRFHVVNLRRLIATGIGGICVALGYLIPQCIAYKEYCTNSGDLSMRPWCQKALPSIYAFVQDHYWNVGLFRYWTVSNVPLFLLAAPMIAIMVASSSWALDLASQDSKHRAMAKHSQGSATATRILSNLAISQLFLVGLILTTAHVQIITRLSSSYPVWLWYVANLLGRRSKAARKFIVPFKVVYAVVQGGLFASFLPPA